MRDKPLPTAPGRALRLAAALLLLFLLWLVLRRLPALRWVVAGARLAQGLGPAGVLLAAVAIFACTLLLLPVVPLIVACGWLYGPWSALLSLAAAVGSAATSFSVARALGHTAAAQALAARPKARALADLAAEGGVLTVLLVRLSPVLPFTPSNAVLGLTSLRLRDLVVGTALGMAPGTLLFAWSGSLLPQPEAIAEGAATHAGAVWILFALAFFAAAILGTAAARRLRAVR